jgi:hypothetical protein
MKYYQNINTNEIIGIHNMREVIMEPNNNSIKSGYKDYSYSVVYDMVCPNRLIPNGIDSFCIEHVFLIKNYKRIKRELALEKYPLFKQYDYNDLKNEAEILNVSKLDIIKKQTF